MPQRHPASQLRAGRNEFEKLSETVAGAAAATKILGIDVELSLVTADGASNNTFTLPNGQAPGQRKIVVLTAKASTGNAVVTPTNLRNGTSVTLDTAAENALFVFDGVEWNFVGGTGALS